jgi:hypothetical protein
MSLNSTNDDDDDDDDDDDESDGGKSLRSNMSSMSQRSQRGFHGRPRVRARQTALRRSYDSQMSDGSMERNSGHGGLHSVQSALTLLLRGGGGEDAIELDEDARAQMVFRILQRYPIGIEKFSELADALGLDISVGEKAPEVIKKDGSSQTDDSMDSLLRTYLDAVKELVRSDYL